MTAFSSPRESSPLLPTTTTPSFCEDDYGSTTTPPTTSHSSTTASSSFHGSFRRFSSQLSKLIQSHTGSIGYLGSFAIATNSLTGPAMLNLPATFERSGIIPTIATLVFVCVLSAFCCMHMANTISKIPGNAEFKQEVEFSDGFQHYWGRKWFIATQVLFFGCIACLNISSIVDTAHVVDTFLGHWWPPSTALQVNDDGFQWVYWDFSECSEKQLMKGDCLPFVGQDGFLFTAGNVIVTLIFLPLALMDLKENAIVQIVGFLILLITSIQFVIEFWVSGVSMSNASWWGDDWSDLFGVVLFNFALVIAIPAWLYEREPHVNVGTVVYGSSGLSLVLYIAIGLLGDMAMPHVSDNMLESMMSGSMGSFMQLGASIFAFAIIGLGIPLFSVLTRLNLTGSGLCSRRTGNILAVYLPFTVSWFLYDSTAVTKLLSWGGTIFTGLVAFILPLLLTIHVVKQISNEGSVSVYFGWTMTKEAEFQSLRLILCLMVFSILAAIAGNFVHDSSDD